MLFLGVEDDDCCCCLSVGDFEEEDILDIEEDGRSSKVSAFRFVGAINKKILKIKI